MKTFYAQIALFFSIQATLAVLLLATYDLPRETNYLASTIDKHRWLHQTPSPRIILVGGSNLPFGIQSELLEAAAHRPVVNMGITAMLGVKYLLDEVRGEIRKGDLVILSLEYDFIHGGYGPVQLQQVMEYRPANLLYLDAATAYDCFLHRSLPYAGQILRRSVREWLHAPLKPTTDESIYSRFGYNRQGDMTNHYGKASVLSLADEKVWRRKWPATVLAQKSRGYLVDFADYCHRQGAVVVFTCPPHHRTLVEAKSNQLAQIMSGLKSIPFLTVLDTPEDQAYPGADFFDTHYHLMDKVARQRTEQLIARLRDHGLL